MKQVNDPSPTEYEIVFNKQLIQKSRQEDKSGTTENTDTAVETASISKDESQDMFDTKYAAFNIQVDPIKFKYSNAFLLSMKPINNLKSKVRLLGHHTNIISSIIMGNQKRMEQLHK
jgi:hypothetical protein